MNSLVAGSLRLESQVEGHAAEMFEVLSDPAIYEFENRPPESLAKLQDWFRKLQTRRSPDGREQWLNWVVRLPSGKLAVYVQATVLADGRAFMAYELASRFWRQGICSTAMAAVIEELEAAHGVDTGGAVFKTANFRSHALLRHLAFAVAPPVGVAPASVEPDDRAIYKASGNRKNAV